MSPWRAALWATKAAAVPFLLALLIGSARADEASTVGRVQAMEDELQESLVSAEDWKTELDQVVLRTFLAQAEKRYRINIRGRNLMENGELLTNPQIKPSLLKEAILLPTWPCPLEGRLGVWGDGGKWVCLMHSGATQKPVTVSIGCHGELSFEKEMYAQLGAVIHTYDPTLSPALKDRMRSISYLTFHDTGLSGQKHIEATLASLPRQFRNAALVTVPQLLADLNVAFVDVFKIDCEGCEYGVVEDMVTFYNRTTAPFGQILMEVHALHLITNAQTLVARLESLGYRMFHTEANGYDMRAYEIAFIHEKLTRL